MTKKRLLTILFACLICGSAQGQIVQRGPHSLPSAALTARYVPGGAYSQPARSLSAYVPRSFDSPGCQQNRRQQYAQNFYALRSMHEQYVQAHHVDRPTTEQLAIQAKRYAPERLDVQEQRSRLNNQGSIQWPQALQDQAYERERTEIEQAIMLGDYSATRRWIALCDERLIAHASEIDAERYAAAKKFLAGLKYGS